jgi:hypothetical protein
MSHKLATGWPQAVKAGARAAGLTAALRAARPTIAADLKGHVSTVATLINAMVSGQPKART